MFCEEKSTQMAVYLLSKEGKHMPSIKLMNLLYLSDRESMDRFGYTMTGDRMIAMPSGPALSSILCLMNGELQEPMKGWGKWVKGAENYHLTLSSTPSNDYYDELSIADIAILDEIYAQFSSMDKLEMRQYIHQHCLEWKNPHGGSFTIKIENVFRALGKNEHEVNILSHLMRQRHEQDIAVGDFK